MSLVRVQHPALPIRADIADADLPGNCRRADPVLQIQPLDEGLKVTMVTRPFGPAGPFYLVGLGGQSVLATIDGVRQRADRDLDAERRHAQAMLADLPMLEREATSGHEWTIGDAGSALEFLLQVRQRQPPILVEWPEGRKLAVRAEVSAANLSLKIARARNWFQMDGEVSVDEELVLDMRDLLSRLDRAQGRFVPLADGSFLALTEQFRKQLERLNGISEDHGKGRRLPILAGVAARELAEDAGLVKADKEWKGFVERLSAAGRRQPEPSSTLQAELRDYQLEGFRWLSRLADWGWRVPRRRHGPGQDRAGAGGAAGAGAAGAGAGDRADVVCGNWRRRRAASRPASQFAAYGERGRPGRGSAGLEAVRRGGRHLRAAASGGGGWRDTLAHVCSTRRRRSRTRTAKRARPCTARAISGWRCPARRSRTGCRIVVDHARSSTRACSARCGVSTALRAPIERDRTRRRSARCAS